MTPRNKLRTANVLMLVGILPLLVGIYWMVANFPELPSDGYQRRSQIADALLLFGKVIFAYVFAVLVSGGGLVWSALVAGRENGTQVFAARTIRILVCVVLLVPAVLLSL